MGVLILTRGTHSFIVALLRNHANKGNEMQDSLEDRIALAGKHDEFTKVYNEFVNSDKHRIDQQIFYDELEGLGASPEEADEFVNMVMENCDDSY